MKADFDKKALDTTEDFTDDMFKAVARKGPKYIKKIKRFGAVSNASWFEPLIDNFYYRLWNCSNQELGRSLMYHRHVIHPKERIVVSTVTQKLTSWLRKGQRTISNGEPRESPRRVTAQSKSALMPRLTCQSLQWAWRVISSHAAEKSDTKLFKLDFQNKWCQQNIKLTSLFFNLRCILIWVLLFNAVTWS